MAIISVIDNQNNRWKRNAKKTTKQNKTKQNKKIIKKGTEAIVKEWKLNDFFVCLGLIFSN